MARRGTFWFSAAPTTAMGAVREAAAASAAAAARRVVRRLGMAQLPGRGCLKSASLDGAPPRPRARLRAVWGWMAACLSGYGAVHEIARRDRTRAGGGGASRGSGAGARRSRSGRAPLRGWPLRPRRRSRARRRRRSGRSRPGRCVPGDPRDGGRGRRGSRQGPPHAASPRGNAHSSRPTHPHAAPSGPRATTPAAALRAAAVT